MLLLDEPFSALDAVTRLHGTWSRGWPASRAVLMVTHDLYEATRMADRVLVMAGGPGLRADIPISTPSAERAGRRCRDPLKSQTHATEGIP
ncbi:hypothetical protein [Celeribacter halophilus]|uniref:hypothetical protein n=1 Tax=Celeribacter halophilus TaxID=576117 RepID=UPI003A900D36